MLKAIKQYKNYDLISDISDYTRRKLLSQSYQNLPTVVLPVCIPPPLEVCYQWSQIHNPSGRLICHLRKQTQSEGWHWGKAGQFPVKIHNNLIYYLHVLFFDMMAQIYVQQKSHYRNCLCAIVIFLWDVFCFSRPQGRGNGLRK